MTADLKVELKYHSVTFLHQRPLNRDQRVEIHMVIQVPIHGPKPSPANFDGFSPGSQDERLNIGIPPWLLWSLPLISHWAAYQMLGKLDDATSLVFLSTLKCKVIHSPYPRFWEGLHVHPTRLQIHRHFVYKYTLNSSTCTPFLDRHNSTFPTRILSNDGRSVEYSERHIGAPYVNLQNSNSLL